MIIVGNFHISIVVRKIIFIVIPHCTTIHYHFKPLHIIRIKDVSLELNVKYDHIKIYNIQNL